MYSTEVERRFNELVKGGLFGAGFPILALVRGWEVLVKATPEEGIDIYSDYSLGTKDFSILDCGKGLQSYGSDFSVGDLMDVMKSLEGALVVVPVSEPNEELPQSMSSERFHQICLMTSSRHRANQFETKRRIELAQQRFRNESKTLDQWFATKVK